MKFKSKELKEIIKHYVRESLMEVLAEANIRSIVENTIKNNSMKYTNIDLDFENSFPKSSVAEIMKDSSNSDNVLMEQRKRKVLDSFSLPDEAWSSIYEDTAKSNNSVLKTDRSHSSKVSESPELVSENVMQSMGLMNMDFSKFIDSSKLGESKISDSDMNELLQKRQEMLKKNIIK